MSEEWGELSPERIGKATASRIADIMASTKNGGFGASRSGYRAELICERMTGITVDALGHLPAIKWGKENEPIARAAYEHERQITVEFAGFVSHPTIAGAGCSPDGFATEQGLIEIKCPYKQHIHLSALEGDKIAEKYMLQMQFQMSCTGRTWCDFVSFDPRWDANNRLFIQRVPRDDVLIKKIEDAVSLFLTEVDNGVLLLRKRSGGL